MVADGQDAAEDVVVGLHALGRPEPAATVQRKELEGAGVGNGTVGRTTELHFGGNGTFNLRKKSRKFARRLKVNLHGRQRQTAFAV